MDLEAGAPRKRRRAFTTAQIAGQAGIAKWRVYAILLYLEHRGLVEIQPRRQGTPSNAPARYRLTRTKKGGAPRGH
mgnify:CR=1 FL=1